MASANQVEHQWLTRISIMRQTHTCTHSRCSSSKKEGDLEARCEHGRYHIEGHCQNDTATHYGHKCRGIRRKDDRVGFRFYSRTVSEPDPGKSVAPPYFTKERFRVPYNPYYIGDDDCS